MTPDSPTEYAKRRGIPQLLLLPFLPAIASARGYSVSKLRGDIIGPHNIFETGFGVFGSAKLAVRRARDFVGSSFDTAGLDVED
jgi:hypothetical protein